MQSESAKKRLALFDVDGTLVKQWSNVPSQSGLQIKKYFNLDSGGLTLHGDGMTDCQILVEKLKLLGVKNPESDPRLGVALSGYAAITKETMKKFKIEPIPGAERLIKLLLNKGVTLGLLTGNTPGRAKVKLESVGLWQYFKIGAFGDATTKRSELVQIAINEAKRELDISFDRADVFIIGDTVRDVQCAKEAGVKSIAVATGKQSLGLLSAENPDFTFKDFSDIESMANAITK